jgi:drug/metabolite transporter (DMT)-like permease
MTLQTGLLLAVACALATNLAFLCKHRGAVAAPDVSIRHPLRSAAGLFRSRWWTIGFAIAVAAWGLHVAALGLAPLSLVQAVISGGLVLLAVLGERWFGLTPGRREWLGLFLSAAGLALLAVTIEGTSGGDHSGYSTSAMIAFEGGLVAIGALLVLSHRWEQARQRHGVLLGAAAGLLFGVSDIAIKALTGTVPGDALALLSPWTLVAALASIAAFYTSARSLQISEAIPVIALTSVSANASAILGGIIVFGDPIGDGTFEVLARAAAFATVIAATALMPAPLRAAQARA